MADRSYGPTVLCGLVGAAVTAVAGTRDWALATADAAGIKVDASVNGSDSAPLVAALAFVALAAWGVVLVLRGRLRRWVAALGALASLGALIAVVAAFRGARNDATAALMGQAGSGGVAGEVAEASLTGWYYVAGFAALVTLLAFLVAIWRSPVWPTMGTKYDAPAARAEAPVSDEDMWRALDHGHDPTS
ncbi:MAG TPA: Trp biosynthesis-associated membrane protein [Nocardioidaceae bacterium]|nr:Trp biosynthesis-associated membrane protein [Nocardioidaceae bacterium]